ncbi:MAG: hypothetical protein IH897_05840, partial [Planctomycetes bacterium]|nr:hypothetical protein [Planctomycetota bacterium]
AMITAGPSVTNVSRLATPAGHALPSWVYEQLGACPVSRHPVDVSGMSVQVADAKDLALVSVVVPDALSLPSLEFQRCAAKAYAAVARSLNRMNARHPVRFWNFIPDIHSSTGDGMDRYMVFNAGRFAAFTEWYGGIDRFDHRLATATGIGHDGADLVIHALGSDRPGVHIDNPRQCSPHCYSTRYGPLPPCFARATVVERGATSPPLWLIGGTSSVFGEASVHDRDVAGQVEETFLNLSCLLETIGGATASQGTSTRETRVDWLKSFRHLRVYYRVPDHAERIREMVGQRLPHLSNVEYLRSDICRRELLVEMEGIA